jgi:hypothetical protein
VAAFDDAHLADASSWQAREYLGRKIMEGRVLVVAASNRLS